MSQYDKSTWEAEWKAAATPKGPVVHIHFRLADASREGSALVAGCGPQPVGPPDSKCSLSQGGPPTANNQPARTPSPKERPPRAAQSEAAKKAEAEHRQAIGRFQAFAQVATVMATRRPPGPDYFGLGRHGARNVSGPPARAVTRRE